MSLSNYIVDNLPDSSNLKKWWCQNVLSNSKNRVNNSDKHNHKWV